MSTLTGHKIADGTPFINGKRAIWDDEERFLLSDVLSQWRCPECNARLSKDSLICLNACHLSAASYKRFNNLMGHFQKLSEDKT